MRNKLIISIVVLALVTLVSGATYLALASPGSPEDPFIVLSYLNDIFRPKLMEDVGKIESDINKKVDDRIALYGTQSGSGSKPEDSEVFRLVDLTNGQSLVCSRGTEVLLRVGTANGFGTAPALVNYTAGTTLSAGSALAANNMYLITIEGNGITATANLVRVLVRGDYKIS